MHWRKVGASQYLGRKHGKVWQSLGARSSETEAMKAAYLEQRTRLKARMTRLDAKLVGQLPGSPGLRIAQVLGLAAVVLRSNKEAS